MSVPKKNHWLIYQRLRFLVTVLLVVSCADRTESAVTLTKSEDKVRVEIDGELFAEYIYQGQPKPILYPVIGPHGIGMTRNYPMVSDSFGEAHDHPHHQSLWFTHGSVNDIDFWSILEGAGRILHDQFLRLKAGGGRAVIRSTNRWLGPDGKLVCTDTRQISFGISDSARNISWTITIHASSGDLRFGDTKEGAMGIRTHPQLRLTANPERGVKSVSGNAANSEGVTGADIWGKRASWVDYWGPIDDQVVGIAIFDHPSNLRHPTWWHARTYGLVAANPFGIHDFEGKPDGAGDMTVPAGESITLRYRFVFHEGDANQAKIAERYAAFAKSEE